MFVKFGKGKILGNWGRFAVSDTLEDITYLDPDGVRAAKGAAQTTATSEKTVGDVIGGFVQSLTAIKNNMPALMTFFPITREVTVDTEGYQELGKRAAKVFENADEVAFEIGASEYGGIVKLLRRIKNIHELSVAAPNFFLVGMVSTYDGFITSLLDLYFRKHPGAFLAAEKSIPCKLIATTKTYDGLLETLREQAIEEIMRGGHSGHIKWLEKQFKFEIGNQIKSYKTFLEVGERRNILVHNNGLANRKYIEACKKLSCLDPIDLEPDTVLQVNDRYFDSAVSSLIEAGVVIGHLLWWKVWPDHKKEADQSLSRLGYDLLADGDYKLAQRILEFGSSVEDHAEEKIRLMIVVNLANAYRLGGDLANAKRVIEGEDWGATADMFKVCVHSINGEYEKAASCVRKIGIMGDVKKADYRSWPAFIGFRQSSEFRAAYREVFGEEFEVSEAEELVEDAKQIMETTKSIED